jgi:adenine-specific DNA-methyltransferase
MPLLDWLNKQDAVRTVQKVPYRMLEAVPELSAGDANTENMLIQGDNLEALKALLPLYAGKVKCIYADPPFNTEQAFPDYDDNLEHTLWLSLMYPALELQRELLSLDGTLFIHIDDNELGYLIAIADEVMGRKNRMAIVTFRQGAATGHKSINPGMVSVTNFLLVYARSKQHWKPNRLFTGRERDKRYGHFLINPDDHYSKWQLEPLSKAFCRFNNKPLAELKKDLGNSFEEVLNEFVIANADRVIQPVRPDYNAVSDEARQLIDKSLAQPDEIFLLNRQGYSDMYFKAGQRWIFYREKLKEIDGVLVAGEPLTTLWDDLLSNNLHQEGGVELPKSKKPEGLIKRVLELGSMPGDIILDAYLGSGTTAAVAHKMSRRYIGIERGDHAVTKCHPRLVSVVNGEQSGVSKAVNWQGGGGFHYFRLGETIFDAAGSIHHNVRFASLAAHIWFCETRVPLAVPADSPLLGIHDDTAYYLLYNGILGDRRPQGGNVLTQAVLDRLPPHNGRKIIYGEASRFGKARLEAENIVFKQIPYDVRAV